MKGWVILLAGAVVSGLLSVVLGLHPASGIVFGIGVLTGLSHERWRWLNEVRKLR